MGSVMFKKGKEKLVCPVSSFFELSAKDIDGNVVKMNQYSERKLLLVVNVASNCGLTKKNYHQLNELYEEYKQKGLEILAFPSNDFMSQEPGCGAVPFLILGHQKNGQRLLQSHLPPLRKNTRQRSRLPSHLCIPQNQQCRTTLPRRLSSNTLELR